MPDRERTVRGLECCAFFGKCADGECPYYDDYTCTTALAHDALALLREQEQQKAKWLKAIADNQLAHAPNETDSDMEKMRKTGIWYGLEIAYEILMEDSHERMDQCQGTAAGER